MTLTWRQGTHHDWLAAIGTAPPCSLRLWVVEKEGAIVALGGVAYDRLRPNQIFSKVLDGGKAHGVALMLIARRIMRELGKSAWARGGDRCSARILPLLGMELAGWEGATPLYRCKP